MATAGDSPVSFPFSQDQSADSAPVSAGQLRWRPGMLMRTLKELPVSW